MHCCDVPEGHYLPVMQQEQKRRISEKPSLAEPISGLMTSTCFDWPTRTAKRSVPYTETTEAIFIYSMAIVMQREREAFHVGALTALTGERVVIFVIRNFSVPVA